MRDKFPGYFPLNDSAKDQLFETATFAFDACVLLNIYSYSEETRNEFLGLLEQIKDRVWVPYQCAKEFLKNRPNRIKAQLGKFDAQLKRIDEFGKSFNDAHRERRAHPFYSDKARKDTDSLVELLTQELKANREKVKKLLHEDPLQDRLASILDSKVGEPFPTGELEKIYKEGKKRYSMEVPPGYEDLKEKGEPDRYGDLVHWKETLRYAKDNSSDMVLVTDDSKPDWWQKVNGQTLGPRPELLQEFATETNQTILIYRGLDFLRRANASLNNVTVTDDAIREIESTISDRNRQFFHDIFSKLSTNDWSQHAQKQQQASLALNSAMAMIQEYDPSRWSILGTALRERRIDVEGITDVTDALKRLSSFLTEDKSSD